MSAASDGSAVPQAGAPARPPPRQAAGFCAGALLVLGLSYLHPLALALGLPLALGAFWLWPLRWALPAALLVAALLLYRGGAALRLPLPGDGALLWLCLLSLIFGIVRALHIDALIREGAARQHLLEELEQTRQELLAGERRAGVLEERQRLARDIHDTLAQGFAGIVMHLEAAEQALPPEAPTAARHLDEARRTAREGLSEARRLVHALRPEHLERASLPEAVARVVRRFAEEHGVAAEADVAGAAPLPPAIEVTLLRATQEALANVRRHARAAAVRVALRYEADAVRLEVRDDGVGFDPGRAGGFGLLGMAERAAALGGRCEVRSAPGQGTTVTIHVPLGPGAAAPGAKEAAP